MNNKIILFQQRLIFHAKSKQCIYYMDLNKKWKFYTNQQGFKLLKYCYSYIKKILLLYKSKYNINYNEGKRIYSQKSNLKITGITWTEQEYNNHSLRYVYIIVKSFQRFTEMWSMLESFNSFYTLDKNKKYNVMSLGCGPGFECLAFKTFYNLYKQNIQIYGIDSIKNWKSAFEMFGTFYTIDIIKYKLFDKFHNKLDFVILSNVYANYMTNPKGTKFISYLFEHNVQFILINDRSKDLSFFIKEFKNLGINTYFLLNKNDHRQICLTKLKLIQKNINVTHIFPNVPFI